MKNCKKSASKILNVSKKLLIAGHESKCLSSHRSHEEIRSRRKSQQESREVEQSRYHSAPSVIHEVLHRRDWERSTKDLQRPSVLYPSEENNYSSDTTLCQLQAPHAVAEMTSIEDTIAHYSPASMPTKIKMCKKHYTNIKSSAKKRQDVTSDKELCSAAQDEKLESPFDDEIIESDYVKQKVMESPIRERRRDNTKQTKQNINECIRTKEKSTCVKLNKLEENEILNDVPLIVDQVGIFSRLDRSGAEHHTIESRIATDYKLMNVPPISVGKTAILLIL